MLASETAHEITDKPADEVVTEVEEELDTVNTGEGGQRKLSVDTTQSKEITLPTSLKSSVQVGRGDGKRVRINQPRGSAAGSQVPIIKRDPVVEAIIESRKLSIIDNTYTRLAQSTRPPQRNNLFDIRPPTSESETKRRDRAQSSVSSQSEKPKVSVPTTIEYNVDGWDEGLTEEIEKDNIAPADKTCLQLYEEKCQRLNLCPCTIIQRSLNTTYIDLTNYGLGPRGCIALAVGLIRNTTVLSLNLAGNNIGDAGMTHLYQIITENAFIEEYDLSFNNLGPKGNAKLAKAITSCSQLKSLNVAGNELTSTDIILLLSKLEDHSHLKHLNISHNELDEEGGTFFAGWLRENHVLVTLDASWCSIRLAGANAVAKAIGENNRLEVLDLSHNSFTNQTVPLITSSLTSNSSLLELNLRGSHFISRYEATMKDDPSSLITGKDCQIYDMLVAAATSQSLRIFRLGENHIDERCLILMLESLAEVEEISLKELDLTGIMTNGNFIAKGHALFANHPTLEVYVGPVKHMIESFANNLLGSIRAYSQENEATLTEMFLPNESAATTVTTITYEQFLDGLRRAKIPFPTALMNDIIKHLGQTSEQGLISLKSLQL